MTASELRDALDALIAEHGDATVYTALDYVTGVEVECWDDGAPRAFVIR